ncbi:MAG: glutathione peroxidase [Chromatiaceae bacterium]|nr:MAG: glutathione peroxidase [Chromatiaceae bacterium]
MIRFLLVCLLIPLLASPAFAVQEPPGYAELFDHDMRRLHSSEVVNLRERFAGQPLLIVNTASHCGFTGQFSGLEAVHEKYADRGLRVMGFPSNDFNQEASDEAETAQVCFRNFGVSFDMFAPIGVRGDDAHPIFQELARQSRAPRWNFYKYLVDRNGQVVAAYSSMVSPESRRFERAIEDLLGN